MKISNKYHLIYICENDLSQQIGGTIHVKEVLDSLIKLHNNITLIAPNYHDKNIDIAHGIQTIFIKTSQLRIIKWLYFYLTSTFQIFRIYLKTGKIIVYSREMSYNMFLPLLIKIFNIPLFIEVNGILLKEMEDLNYSRSAYYFTRLLEKMNFQAATHIISVSDEIKRSINHLLKIHCNNITVVPNGTDTNLFYPMDKDECRKKTEVDISKFIIGFIGSCYPYHDIDTLIKAVPNLADKIPNIHVMIVGNGYMLDKWKNLSETLGITDKITFNGYIPYSKTNIYINSFDICYAVYKTNVFGIGMKIMDYMSCNRPVITSQLQAFTNILPSQDSIQFVEPENVPSLINGITNISNNKNNIKVTHRKFIINNYTWDHTAQNIMKVIEKTLCAA